MIKYMQLLFGIVTFLLIVTTVSTNNMLFMPWLMLALGLTCFFFSIDSLRHQEKGLGWSLLIVSILVFCVMFKGFVDY